MPPKKTAKPAKPQKSCDCQDHVNEQLKPYNTFVESKMLMSFETGKFRESTPMIVTAKIDSKKRQPAMPIFCAYCPFCGKKYPDEK